MIRKLVLVGVSLLPVPVAAQTVQPDEPTAAPSPAADERQTRDDIVVTATSIASVGEQPIINTPRTVQAIGSAVIQNIAPSSLQEITKFFPTLTPRSSYNDPSQLVFARGINEATTQRDGLEWRDNFLPLEEVDRIEVLQGVPDVTQGGDKTPGGVVNFVPKHPLAQDFARVTAGVNEYGNVLGQADFNLSLDPADRFGVRSNLAAERIDLPDHSDGHRYAAALAGRALVSAGLTLDVNGFYTDQRRHGINSGFFPLEDDVRLPDLSYHKSYGQDWSGDHYRRGAIEAKLAGDLGDGWSLSLQGGYSTYNFSRRFPSYAALKADGSVDVAYYADDSRVRNSGARAAVTKANRFASWLTNKLAVIGTAYDDRLRYAYVFADAGNANLYGDQRVARPVVALDRPTPANSNRVYTIGVVDEATLFERLTITAGAQRYRAVAKSFDQGVLNTRIALTKWLPSVSALVRIEPAWTIYATYNEAVEQGTNVYQPYANAGEQLPPLLSKTYEIGTKAQIGGLLATLSAYTFKRPAEVAVGDRLEQAGASRYRGIDFSVSGQIVPRVTLIAAADLIYAKILRADDPAIVGKVPTNVPRFSTSLFAEYQPLDGLFVSAGVFHVSRKPGDDANALFYAPDYTTFDLGGRYETRLAGHKATIRVEATNITDKFYYASSIFSSPIYGAPRFVKTSLTVEY
ncbi:TonB-dependent receptor [Sphingomonas bacterium]|uniref:TonB-dependent receptor n=1 Tax=Sphingomonas bacterium TaxID=1895847 RepID=UPI0015752582|nr:TonB-dependent receptor [Sphingomonas bacterium]